MILRGATGEVRWVYMTAATFGPWEIEQRGVTSALTGKLVSVDDYRATQAPLSVVVTVGRQRLTFPVVDLQITGSVVTATLGPRQE